MIGILEQYMLKVEEAEGVYYDGGDYKSMIEEANVILSKITMLSQMFDEYVEYTNTERSKTYLELTRKALSEQTALPRMHFVAYTVLRGEYPESITSIRSPLPFMKKIKVKYANGDIVYFTNKKLTKEDKAEE
jgi:hypothetical protein